MSPLLTELTVADPPEAWRSGGFTVRDDGTVRIGSVTLRLVGREQGKRIQGWSFDGWSDGDIDGLATSGAPATEGGPDDHPNGATMIDHVVILSPDLDRTVAVLEGFGFDVRRTRDTDTYGAPMRQVFFRSGEVVLELIGPPEPMGDGPAGFFGLAITVTDLDATAALLGEACGVPKDAVQPGRRIATLRHKAVGMSVATAFMTPEPGR